MFLVVVMYSDSKIIKVAGFDISVCIKWDVNAVKLAIIIPWKLDTKDYKHIQSHQDFLSKKGFLTVSFDWPWIWGGWWNIEDYTTTNNIKVINWLIEYFGNKKTILIWHSKGWNLAMLVWTENESVLWFVLIMSPWFEKDKKRFPDLKRKKNWYISYRDNPKWWELVSFDLPYSILEDEVIYCVKDSLKKHQKKAFFIVWKQDTIIDPKLVKNLFEISSGVKEYFEIDAIHDYRKDLKMVNEVNNIIWKFVDELI